MPNTPSKAVSPVRTHPSRRCQACTITGSANIVTKECTESGWSLRNRAPAAVSEKPPLAPSRSTPSAASVRNRRCIDTGSASHSAASSGAVISPSPIRSATPKRAPVATTWAAMCPNTNPTSAALASPADPVSVPP